MKSFITTLFFVLTFSLSNAQNDNPYAKFGYEGNTIKTPQERLNYMLIVPNKDSLSFINSIGIEPKNGKYYLFDRKNEIVFQDTLTASQLARFFAVDPLTKKYPHYTPYSFSGNKVISHIEIEGLEDLDIRVHNPATPNNPGNAALTITMAHQIVTQGVGQLHNQANINPANYTAAYDAGDITLYSTNLPSATQSANFLNGRQERWARRASTDPDPSVRAKFNQKLASDGVTSFYSINVDYNYSLNTTPNTTLNDAVVWTSQNVAGRGIIFNAENNIQGQIGRANYNQNPSIYGGILAVNSIGIGLSNNEGAAGLSEGMLGGNNPSTNYNFIAGNPSLFGAGSSYNFPLSGTGVMIHEVGHNNASVNIHGTGNYEYNQSGTQSNQNPRPTRQNTINTINDQTNRNSF